jgi:hypothetical protein
MAINNVNTTNEQDLLIARQIKIDNGKRLDAGLPEFTQATWTQYFWDFCLSRLANDVRTKQIQQVVNGLQFDTTGTMLSAATKIAADPDFAAQVDAMPTLVATPKG